MEDVQNIHAPEEKRWSGPQSGEDHSRNYDAAIIHEDIIRKAHKIAYDVSDQSVSPDHPEEAMVIDQGMGASEFIYNEHPLTETWIYDGGFVYKGER
jgi:hypothetical protein